MKTKFTEYSATLFTVVALAGLPAVIFQEAPWKAASGERVIHLTAIMKEGIWTCQEVNGSNYWWKSFYPSTLVLKKGETIRLRLTSSDVTHSFYMPELFPEPMVVKAGYTEEIVITPQESGEFTYYCTTVCGECHYFMRGSIRVLEEDGTLKATNKFKPWTCIHMSKTMNIEPEKTESLVTKGAYLFKNRWCFTCHGESGKGGVYNPNYVNQYVPALNTLAERMKLYWQEDTDTIIHLLEEGADLEALKADPPIEGYNRFLAQFNSYRQKIINGAPQLQKLEQDGPDPPLVMPSWIHQLSDEDLNAILAYLISEFPWDEYE